MSLKGFIGLWNIPEERGLAASKHTPKGQVSMDLKTWGSKSTLMGWSEKPSDGMGSEIIAKALKRKTINMDTIIKEY